MGGSIAPFPKHQLFDNNGVPAASHRLFTYAAGSSTEVATYTDEGLTSANTNPIVLDSAGRATIFLTPGVAYKFVFAAPGSDEPPASPIWTVDNVNSTRATELDVDVTGIAGESVTTNQVVYVSTGAGADSARTPGRWYVGDPTTLIRAVDANMIGVAITAAATGDSFTVRLAGKISPSLSLAPGSLFYIGPVGSFTVTPPANPRPIAVMDPNGDLFISPWVPITDASATHSGRVTTGTQTFAGAKTFSSAVTHTVAPIGAAEINRCTAALTKNNNTTLADVTGLAFAVAANETWAFRFVLKGVSTTTAHWKFAVTGPSAPTAVWYGHGRPSNIGIAATDTLATEILREGITADPGTEEMIEIAGYIRNGANAGTIQLQAAQQTAQVFNTIIRAESYVIAHREA